mmetsp:Transcript_20460/g.36734  ORF Transcript_20460/g.36734 Transcript_20460/m.36734 type:complete len:178 (+) Transcript_20460:99-632(+)|eukprot:CAMPEP_0197629718 /NCGR_PEP_ID=MMETSP1338-20131121/7462_1 /TAXON_ID=43686 ORGANISM="Pelagodinium beii, Strain RCC1491" /NCGR_SAMPLE_ID=MMETSP1338 /ASSEMBLY_ACC=CAM_ASM_000754 /LENGTH=177 /DNA_ID=CAMNT_0043200803 /DNA_START=92 /DNA_END=625 /DNA_ORIENTATION=-
MFLCKPLRCLSFLGGKKPPNNPYEPVDQQHVGNVGKSAVDMDDDDEDDFFGDGWGEQASGSGSSVPSQAAKALPQAQGSGVERNITQTTTTKRAGVNSSPAASSSGSPPVPKVAAQKKQNTDFFGEMGMEPDYKAPRILSAAPAAGLGKGGSLDAMLDDDEVPAAGAAGWGDDDLEL